VSAFEKEFDQSLGFKDASITFWGMLNLALFHAGKPGVVIGEQGWLFTREEFDFPLGYDGHISQNLSFIRTVHSNLKDNNINLIVVPIPAKSRVLSTYLRHHKLPNYREKIYGDFQQFLMSHNITFVDTLSVFQKTQPTSIYLKTDTHWTPEGARYAAHAVAHVSASTFPYLTYPATSYDLKIGEPKPHRGDLLRYVRAEPIESFWGIVPDQIRPYQAVSQDNSDDLFSDQTPGIVLVGTSYSANPTWPFIDFLKESLGTDILNMSDEGKGPFEVMSSYLESDSYKNHPPKLIIWEIPERYLPMPSNPIKNASS
jgi:alginate O-acetyltransferase complex protein AlgJ